jgi:GTPase
VISLIDLCGHEKYLKTTMLGMVGMVPDYVMIVVGANLGLSKMTKEHLGIALALNIPFYIVLTKIDMVPEEIVKQQKGDCC